MKQGKRENPASSKEITRAFDGQCGSECRAAIIWKEI